MKAKTSAKMTQIGTLAQVTIRVPRLRVRWSWAGTLVQVTIRVPRLRVRWSWANVNGIRADDNNEKSWFAVRPWVPKGKGVQGKGEVLSAR